MVLPHCRGPKIATTGFDLRSLFVHFGVCVFSYSKADVQSLRTWANELMSQCKEAKPERRGRTRLLGSLAEDLSRLLAPLL